MGAGNSESLAIRRPLKFPNIVSGEVRDLVSGRAIEGLYKNIIHALITDNIRYRFSIRSEAQAVDIVASLSLPLPARSEDRAPPGRKLGVGT